MWTLFPPGGGDRVVRVRGMVRCDEDEVYVRIGQDVFCLRGRVAGAVLAAREAARAASTSIVPLITGPKCLVR